MKSLLLAAAFATVCAFPAMAQDAPPTDAKPRPGQEMREKMHAEGKQMHEGFKAEHKQMREGNKAEFEAARKDCEARMKSAEGPDAKQGVKKDCRAKHDALRKQNFDENTKRIDARRAEEDARHKEMKAKHDEAKQELKGKREEMKGKHPKPEAPAAAR